MVLKISCNKSETFGVCSYLATPKWITCWPFTSPLGYVKLKIFNFLLLKSTMSEHKFSSLTKDSWIKLDWDLDWANPGAETTLV